MVSGVRLFILLAGCVIAPPCAGQERSIYDDVKLEVIPETHGVEPYPNELVLIRVRGVYRPLVNIAHMIQPALVNFGWTNLTHDTTFETESDGFPARGFERVMALFPERSGDLVIGGFTHKLTVVDGASYRTIDVTSAAVPLKVAEWRGPGGPKDPTRWWLPSSGVRVTDEWSGDPNRTPRGETVRRTVTIEADGVLAEQLPPPPVMRSAGIISFRGPIDRETRVTQNGPVARAIYRWDMRPTTAFPAIVEAVKIPWFDTRARTLREATVPAQRMAWASAGAPVEAATPAPERPSGLAVAGAGVLAFLVGLGVMMAGAGTGAGLPSLPPRALVAMKLAAWRGDASATRAAISRLARDEPDRSRVWTNDAAARSALAELDRHLFGASGMPCPSLGRLSRTIESARRRTAVAMRTKPSALAPLDGPYRR